MYGDPGQYLKNVTDENVEPPLKHESDYWYHTSINFLRALGTLKG